MSGPVKEGYDVVVIGQGVFGASALWECSKRGESCLGVEQFSTPHVRGSSHGATRIIRSVYQDPLYAELVKVAWDKWEELEQAANTELITLTGAVDFCETKSDYYPSLLNTLETVKIPHEILDHEEVKERIPGFSTPSDYTTFYTKKAGVIRASKSVQTLQSQAVKFGATIIDEYALDKVDQSGKGTIIITLKSNRRARPESIKVTCKKLIICPGAWLSPLVKKLFDIPIQSQVLKMGYYYFDTVGNDRNVYDMSRFPVFISYDHAHIYGTPAFEYPSLLKVGVHRESFKSSFTTATDRNFRVVDELLDVAKERVKIHFPLADYRNPVLTETCLYTWTKDAHFVLDQIPSNPNIVIGGGGSGHGFKHGAAVGSILADLALNGSSSFDSQYFKIPFHTASQL